MSAQKTSNIRTVNFRTKAKKAFQLTAVTQDDALNLSAQVTLEQIIAIARKLVPHDVVDFEAGNTGLVEVLSTAALLTYSKIAKTRMSQTEIMALRQFVAEARGI